MSCMTPAADGHAHLDRRPRGQGVPRRRHRVADGQPPARLPGLRRGRRVPPAGHDRDDRPRLPPVPLPQAHPPQPGPGPVRQPRDEPLHPVLPLRALLPRLRRRPRPRRLRLRTTTSTSAAHEDGVLESEFSGNLVEVCPTGVFTDKTLKQHYTRKWDLQTAPSVCVHCGLGCNTIPGERYGTLRRIRNRYNGEVNGYFLCDRGRYGYEFVNSDRAHPRSRCCADRGAATPTRRRARGAAAALAELLRRPARVDRHRLAAGLARGQLRPADAGRARTASTRACPDASARLIGTIARRSCATARRAPPSLQEVELADAVLVLGEDVTNTAPMLALALRQAVRQQPLEAARQAAASPPGTTPPCARPIQDDAGPALRRHAVRRRRLDDDRRRRPTAPRRTTSPASASPWRTRSTPSAPAVERPAGRAARAAPARSPQALRAAERPLVVAGHRLRQRGGASRPRPTSPGRSARSGHAGRALPSPCRSATASALALLGGGSLDEAVAGRRERARPTRSIVLENDLYRRRRRGVGGRASSRARSTSSSLDHLANATTAQGRGGAARRRRSPRPTARWSTTRAGRSGSSRCSPPAGDVQESWRWLRDIAGGRRPRRTRRPWREPGRRRRGAWPRRCPALPAIARGRAAGGLPHRRPEDPAPAAPLQRPHRDARRTSTCTSRSRREDPDSPLAFSMEGYAGPAARRR